MDAHLRTVTASGMVSSSTSTAHFSSSVFNGGSEPFVSWTQRPLRVPGGTDVASDKNHNRIKREKLSDGSTADRPY